MTWNPNDLKHNANNHVHSDEESAPEAQAAFSTRTPIQSVLHRFIFDDEEGIRGPTLDEKRAMTEMGIIPDEDWTRIRRQMTRGITPTF